MIKTNNKGAPLTVFRTGSGVLTKTLTRVHGEIKSEAPRMFSGIANTVNLSLNELPNFINGLESDQCFALGVFEGYQDKKIEVLSVNEFEKRGYQYPVHVDDSGTYGTRSGNSMKQSHRGFIMMDYDVDDQETNPIKCPLEFIRLLDKAVPELELADTSFVRTFSTSGGLYLKGSGECIAEPRGFHIYFQVKDARDIKRFSDALEKRCWLAGLGHIKLSKNGSKMLRVPFDTSVFQPERLCFEAGAFIPDREDFFQKRPIPEYYGKKHEVLDTKKLSTVNDQRLRELKEVQNDAKSCPKLLERLEKLRDTNIKRIVHERHYTNDRIDEETARKIVLGRESFILHPSDHLEFEDGRVATVMYAALNPLEFDKASCVDPFRPEKGASKAKFYANFDKWGNTNPVINSFVEGGRQFVLRKSISHHQEKPPAAPSSLGHLFEKPYIIDQQYLPEITLRSGYTFVKSSKGTGKTYSLAKQIKGTEGRVLSISHLISLAKTTAKVFDLEDYNEVEGRNLRMCPRLSICLPSLRRIEGTRYDIIIIDEACQLLRALKSPVVEFPAATVRTLRNLCQMADKVVLMDADLNEEMIDLMYNSKFGILDKDKEMHLVENNFKPAKEKGSGIELYKNHEEKADANAFTKKLLDVVYEQGHGTFYASNTRKDVLKKASLLIKKFGGDPIIAEEHFITEVAGRRIITITSHNSQNEEVQTFVKSINTELRPDDILLSSPSMGTGHSIDAIDGKSFFAETFGYFSKRSGNLPSDCAQHMSRVRECTKVHLCIQDNIQQYPTTPIEILARDINGKKMTLDNQMHFSNVAEYDLVTKSITYNDFGWNSWYVALTVIENANKNEFGDNLLTQLENEGYTINKLYDLDTGTGRFANKQIRQLAEELTRKEREEMVATPLIDEEEYHLLNIGVNLSADETRRVTKKRLAHTFGFEEDGEEFADLLLSSTQRIAARRKSLILGANINHLRFTDALNRLDDLRADKDKTAYAEHYTMLTDFLAELGVIVLNGQLSYDGREIDLKVQKNAFRALGMYQREMDYLHHMKVPSTQDPEEKKQFISKVLGSIGLKFERKRSRVNGIRVTSHQLCDVRLIELNTDLRRAQAASTSGMYNQREEIPIAIESYYFHRLAGNAKSAPMHTFVERMPYEYQRDLFEGLELRQRLSMKMRA